MNEDKFDYIKILLNAKTLTRQQIADTAKVSVRTVHRVAEAKIWGRWPYIMAKALHGYRTPEYKAYLKRRHLPLTPPSIETVTELALSFSEPNEHPKRKSLFSWWPFGSKR